MSTSATWVARGDNKLIYEFLPHDTSCQGNSVEEARKALTDISVADRKATLLDLGCGDGRSYYVFSDREDQLRWIGLDITDSQEVTSRPRRQLPFCFYDGIRVPLADASVDLTYSRQVFEHVRHPELLLGEVYRVLKPAGVFVGSTSHLEPFHSRSYWNYTPYGFCILLREAGFRSIQVRPGIDCLTLIGRRCLSYVRLAELLDHFFDCESPMNMVLELVLRLLRQPTSRRNAFKLLFAGQFCFIASK